MRLFGITCAVFLLFSNTPGATAQSLTCINVPPGLLGWWRAETNTVDELGLNPGTLVNGAAFSLGKAGTAFTFDGQNDYVRIPSGPHFNPGNQFTIEFWMRLDPDNVIGSSNQGLVTSDYYGIEMSTSFRTGIHVYAKTEGTAAFVHSSDPNGGGAVFPPGEWHYIAGTYDGQQLQLYVDGQPWGKPAPLSGSVSPMLQGSSVSLGSEDGRTAFPSTLGTRYFKGQIDEPAIYSRALDPSEISGIYTAGALGKCFNMPPCATASSSLASWWRGEGDGSDAISTNYGNLKNGTQIVESWNGLGFKFNGANQYVEVPNSASLNPPGSFSIEAWVFPDRDHQGTILGKWGGTGQYVNSRSYYLGEIPNRGLVFGISDAAHQGDASFHLFTVENVVTLNAWNHVAAVYDQVTGARTLYVNGSRVAARTDAPISILNGPASVGIGGNFSAPGMPEAFFSGGIDELSFYSGSLSSNEVVRIFNAGKTGKCLTPEHCLQPPIGMLSWWKAEGNGSDSADSHGATLRNGAGFEPGRVDQSFSFDGVNDHAEVPNNPALNPSGSFSIEGWILPKADGFGTIMAKWGDEGDYFNNRSYAFQVSPGGGLYFSISDYQHQWDAAFQTLVASNVVTLHAWNHVAAVYDQSAGTRRIYVNGVPVAQRTHEAITVYNGIAKVGIGALLATSTTTRDPFNGQIDELSFYASALSDEQVKAIYSAGALGKCRPSGPPKIREQPKDFTAVAGGTATFSVVATGAIPMTYQWRFNNTAIVGATQAVLSLSNVTSLNAGPYSVRVWNGLGVAESAAATLTVVPTAKYPPVVTGPLVDRTVNVGTPVEFTVTATGTAPLLYQWFFNDDRIVGATNATLALPDVQLDQAGNYRVAITNDYGIAQSSATLVVNPNPSLVRALNVSALAGDVVSVPIVLTGSGRENALGLSLSFSATRLAFQGIQAGAGAGDASLVLNTNSAGNGRVGILISAPFGKTFAAGTQDIAVVRFTSASSSFGSTSSLTFTDDPISRQVSDANGVALQAQFTGATVTLLASEYEADLAPRPQGDRQVTVTDWVLLGRLAAKLDTVTNAAEFRRADCAPRSTLGDGVIGLTDWVQAGRYAARLDPLTFAGGPEGPTGFVRRAARKLALERQLKIGNLSLQPGETGSLSITLQGKGNENALSFSISFDPAVLEFQSAVAGVGLPAGSALQVNADSADAGKMAVLIGAPAGLTFPPGGNEVLKLTFRAKSSATGAYVVALTDEPVRRDLSDPLAEPLTAEFLNGSVTIGQPPVLTVAAEPGMLVLSWQAGTPDYVLQSTSDLSTGAWNNVSATPELGGGRAMVRVPASEAAAFFRLRQP